jgi:hypothetical protein
LNPRAITREYSPLISKFNLRIPSVPTVPRKFTGEKRRVAILEELREAGCC